MCGIVGYIGDRDALSVLLKGLGKLEYRGYDSAGVAFIQDGRMKVVKAKGRLAKLEEKLGGEKAEGTLGIGHTRWATHGEPSDINSHPHTNTAGDLAVVHNGIIENFAKLKSWLSGKGISFVSDTDQKRRDAGHQNAGGLVCPGRRQRKGAGQDRRGKKG